MRKAVLAALSLLTLATHGAGAAETAQVDAAVQVTGAVNPFRAYASPAIAVDPRDRSTLVIAEGEARGSGCGIQFSTNAGLSWTEGSSPLPKEVAACVRNTNGPLASVAFAPGKPGDEYTVLLGISTAVDPRTDDVYVVWEDTARPSPAILFMRSSDGGATWSQPVKVNDADPGRQWDFNEHEPAISVAPDGRIDVAWLDYRNDYTFRPGPGAQNALQDVYMSSSTDGGETWSPNMRVSDRSIDRRLSDVWSTGVHSAVGLHSMDTWAYVAWDDTRNATADSKAQDVYFTRVRLGTEPPLGAASSSPGTGTKVAWGLGGAALALTFAGIVLFVSKSRLSGGAAHTRATA